MNEKHFEERKTKRLARVAKLKEMGAALALQQWVRAWLERRYTAQKLRWRREEAAVFMQRNARLFVARRKCVWTR